MTSSKYGYFWLQYTNNAEAKIVNIWAEKPVVPSFSIQSLVKVHNYVRFDSQFVDGLFKSLQFGALF